MAEYGWVEIVSTEGDVAICPIAGVFLKEWSTVSSEEKLWSAWCYGAAVASITYTEYIRLRDEMEKHRLRAVKYRAPHV